jgi:hypothetical protein
MHKDFYKKSGVGVLHKKQMISGMKKGKKKVSKWSLILFLDV